MLFSPTPSRSPQRCTRTARCTYSRTSPTPTALPRSPRPSTPQVLCLACCLPILAFLTGPHETLFLMRPLSVVTLPPSGGLQHARSGPVPFIRDGIMFRHKDGHYTPGSAPSPLSLTWKVPTIPSHRPHPTVSPKTGRPCPLAPLCSAMWRCGDAIPCSVASNGPLMPLAPRLLSRTRRPRGTSWTPMLPGWSSSTRQAAADQHSLHTLLGAARLF